MASEARMGRDGEVILEFETIGAVAKISAIDPESLIEISVTGPADDLAMLERTALRKLEWALEKAGQGGTGQGGTGRGAAGRGGTKRVERRKKDGGGGILV